MKNVPDSDALVLQIFRRGDPGHGVTYAGDQSYIRRILEDLCRRLAEPGEPDPPLRLMDEDEARGDGEGDG